jgi:hypothetical protein
MLRLIVLKSVSQEFSIAVELANNHQWFRHFLLEINVNLQIIDASTLHEEMSDSD